MNSDFISHLTSICYATTKTQMRTFIIEISQRLNASIQNRRFLRMRFFFEESDDNVEESQSQKTQITKRFKVFAQFLDTRFTSIQLLNRIRFTTKFSIVIFFVKRRLSSTLMTDDLDQFISFVNFSSLMSAAKRRRITESSSSTQSAQITKDFSSLLSSIVKRRRVDFVSSSSRFKFISVQFTVDSVIIFNEITRMYEIVLKNLLNYLHFYLS